jgi:hypothetical protein
VRHGENHVRLQALNRAPRQQPTPSVVKPEGRPAASVKLGQESCVIKSISAYTLSARSLVKHLEGDEASDKSHWGHQCSETMLTGESWFHISTPPGDLNLCPLWREADR